MKRFARILCLALAAVMLLAVAASCKKDEEETPGSRYDPENDFVRFAIEGQDGVFNPFFSTTAYDSEITGLTQIGMLSTTGKDAVIAYGDNEACVTKDYTEVRLDANGNPIPDGLNAEVAFTEYSASISSICSV